MFSLSALKGLATTFSTAKRIQKGFNLVKEAGKDGILSAETEKKIMAEATKKPFFLSKKSWMSLGGLSFFIANKMLGLGFGIDEIMAILTFLGLTTAAQAAVDMRK